MKKQLPISLQEFINDNKLEASATALARYNKYLVMNARHHHYGTLGSRVNFLNDQVLSFNSAKQEQIMSRFTSDRPCEICGKDDLPTTVHASSMGPISFNYCTLCSAIGAEPNLGEEYIGIWYNKGTDRYYDAANMHIPIYLKSGVHFDTRADYVAYIRKD